MKKILVMMLMLLIFPILLFCQDKEQVISLLYDIDPRSTRYGNKIIFIEEFNFGIPGGKNWLVDWYTEYERGSGKPHTYSLIYVVDVDAKEINMRDQITLRSGDIHPDILSYYHSLPGITVNNGTCQVGDFNDDGYDEILQILDGAPSPSLIITGYDRQTGEEIKYFGRPYYFDGKGNSPTPVEFVTYKGMKGFKLLFDLTNGTPKTPPKNIINTYSAWYFYAWDEAQRKFVEIEELEEDGIESVWQVSEKRNVEEWGWDPSMPYPYEPAVKAVEQQEETTTFAETADEESDQFDIRIVIIVGIAVLAAAIVIILVMRKKKK